MDVANNLQQVCRFPLVAGEEGNHVVDNLCDFIGTVVGWVGIQLHDGWIHSPAAGAGGGCARH